MQLFFILLAVGLLSISATTILGAIASRKYQFDFSSLSLVSLFVYSTLCILTNKWIDTTAAITLVGLMGLFEAVIAWKWIVIFDAHFGEMSEEIKELLKDNYHPHPSMVLAIVLVYMFIGWVSTLLF